MKHHQLVKEMHERCRVVTGETATTNAEAYQRARSPFDDKDVEWLCVTKPKTGHEGENGQFAIYASVPAIHRKLIYAFGVASFNFTLVDSGQADGEYWATGRLQVTWPEGQVCSYDGVGLDSDPKNAETDAFKRAARHTGVGLYLYEVMKMLWLPWYRYPKPHQKYIGHTPHVKPAPDDERNSPPSRIELGKMLVGARKLFGWTDAEWITFLHATLEVEDLPRDYTNEQLATIKSALAAEKERRLLDASHE